MSHRGGWRRRLSVLGILTLLSSIPVGVAAQAPASAAVTITTFAGAGVAGFSGDGGAASSAQLNQPEGLATDDAGNVYIWDNLNRRIREVSGGTISTYSGDGSYCSSSTLTNSWGSDISGICSSSGFGGSAGGELFVNNGGWLDEVDPGGTRSHIAGKVTGNYSPGDGTDFGVSVAPYSLAGGGGGMYFAEASTTGWPGNSIKLWITGRGVSTIAGMSGTATCNYYPDVTSAPLVALGTCIHPQYLTLWSHYLYFFDSSPGWQGPTIWRIDLSEATLHLYRVAGSGSWSDYGANGSTATSDGISRVGPIAIDSNGNLFFGSTNSGSIREVDTSGKMWNITDIGAAQNSYAFDESNNLYISEPTNNKVVEVTGLDPIPNRGNLFALGDSVAAGEGINYGWSYHQTTNGPDWTRTYGTTTWDPPGTSQLTQDCHRSAYGYPHVIAQQMGYTLTDLACTGAQTVNGLLSGQPEGSDGTEPSQLVQAFSDPNHLPDVITLTVGMDNINFGAILSQCYGLFNSDCQNNIQPDGYTLADDTTAAIDAMQSNLDTVIQDIQTLGSQVGKVPHVYMTGYHDPLKSSYGSQTCRDIYPVNWVSGTISAGLSDSEISWVHQELSYMNSAIQAVASAHSSYVAYVSLDNVMSGHQFCDADPWAYGASIRAPTTYAGVNVGGSGDSNNQAPFHPTAAGQYSIAMKIMSSVGS